MGEAWGLRHHHQHRTVVDRERWLVVDGVWEPADARDLRGVGDLRAEDRPGPWDGGTRLRRFCRPPEGLLCTPWLPAVGIGGKWG